MPQEPIAAPVLQVLSGPTTGRLVKLTADLTVIGRSLDCDLVLDPKTVSRRHAEIARRRDEYLIRDLESTRGTYVDGHRVTRPTQLWNEARIQVGEVTLKFLSRSVQVQAGDDDQSTIFAAMDLMAAEDRVAAIARPEEKLRALQKISREFGGELVLDALLGRVLDSLFDIFSQASGGFVLLENQAKELTPEAVKSRTGAQGEGVVVSKTILDRVMKGGQAILSKNTREEMGDVRSIAESRVRSLMCVPIFDAKRRPVGVVQIYADEGRGRFTEEDLDLLASVASQISVAVQNARMHRDLLQQREFERELQFARQVMQALLPERPKSVAGYEFWDCYEPARHVGGDYYGFIPMYGSEAARLEPVRRWAIAVGDVVGKGLPAALLTARLSAEISLFLQDARDPAEVVTKLNRRLTENGVLDMYITFLLVMLDVETHTLHVVNAGHPAPLVRRRNGTVEEIGRETSGLPLAIDGESVYEASETRLEPGEFVMLYTDGVPDAMNSANERYSDARFRALLARVHDSPREAGEAVAADLHAHAAGSVQFDDVTLVAFGRV
ncbi:SpoIIE family protein phosphatase [Paludisphaera mucosa]|uniref:SpoIIE family protein phosphatase n=1 Tax=Paludisphaera mucosa TaxID=3030827 RepID=A0ABT6FG22_9BACT|nr:SpoIIE family protein phosphatase [Paludisphaera mucosa]MDG3006454.1 SpoIIE family protein phosphatase [Paludisphaera mucosa]